MYPLGGLDYLAPSTMADPRFSPSAQNMMVTKGIALKRKGYRQLGDDADDPTVALIEFEISINVRILVRVTTKRFFRYDPGDGLFVDITQLDEDDAPVEWTGDQTNDIDWVVGRGSEGKYLIVTNGKDKPQWWDGVTATFVDFPCNLPDFVTCKTLAQFYDHLFLGNVKTSSSDPQAVAWSTVGTLSDFTNFSTGDAGSAVITGAAGDIIKLKNLGDRLVIYAENSICSVSYLGGSFVFSFELVISETRLTGPNSIVNLGPYHLFAGQENFYLYDGSRELRAVGDKIYRAYKEQLFVEQKNRTFAFLDQAHQRVYWGVPTGAGKITIYLLEFDLFDASNNTWTKIVYNDVPLCMGFFSRDASRRWSDLTNRWNEADWTWSSGAGRKGFPVIVIGSATKVFINDDTTSDDAGVPPVAYWDTVDFTVPQNYLSQFGRWIEIEADLRGSECDVLYSTDQGTSFVNAGHLQLTQDFRPYKVNIDARGRSLRVRLFNNCPASTFQLREEKIYLRPGGAR